MKVTKLLFLAVLVVCLSVGAAWGQATNMEVTWTNSPTTNYGQNNVDNTAISGAWQRVTGDKMKTVTTFNLVAGAALSAGESIEVTIEETQFGSASGIVLTNTKFTLGASDFTAANTYTAKKEITITSPGGFTNAKLRATAVLKPHATTPSSFKDDTIAPVDTKNYVEELTFTVPALSAQSVTSLTPSVTKVAKGQAFDVTAALDGALWATTDNKVTFTFHWGNNAESTWTVPGYITTVTTDPTNPSGTLATLDAGTDDEIENAVRVKVTVPATFAKPYLHILAKATNPVTGIAFSKAVAVEVLADGVLSFDPAELDVKPEDTDRLVWGVAGGDFETLTTGYISGWDAGGITGLKFYEVSKDGKTLTVPEFNNFVKFLTSVDGATADTWDVKAKTQTDSSRIASGKYAITLQASGKKAAAPVTANGTFTLNVGGTSGGTTGPDTGTGTGTVSPDFTVPSANVTMTVPTAGYPNGTSFTVSPTGTRITDLRLGTSGTPQFPLKWNGLTVSASGATVTITGTPESATAAPAEIYAYDASTAKWVKLTTLSMASATTPPPSTPDAPALSANPSSITGAVGTALTTKSITISSTSTVALEAINNVRLANTTATNGLVFNAAAGASTITVSGTPAQAGTYSLQVKAKVGNNTATSSRSIPITIVPARRGNGGGCDAGTGIFAALALLVAIPVIRKKK